MGANLSRKRKRLVKLATTIYDYRHSKLTSSYRMEGLSVSINYVCMRGGGKVSGCVSVCVRVSKQTPCGSISQTINNIYDMYNSDSLGQSTRVYVRLLTSPSRKLFPIKHLS